MSLNLDVAMSEVSKEIGPSFDQRENLPLSNSSRLRLNWCGCSPLLSAMHCAIIVLASSGVSHRAITTWGHVLRVMREGIEVRLPEFLWVQSTSSHQEITHVREFVKVLVHHPESSYQRAVVILIPNAENETGAFLRVTGVCTS